MTESVSVDQEGKNSYFCDSIQLWTWNGCSKPTPVSSTVLIFNPHMHWWRLHIKYVHNIFGQTVEPFSFCPICQFYHICLTSVWFLFYRPPYSSLKLILTFVAIRKKHNKSLSPAVPQTNQHILRQSVSSNCNIDDSANRWNDYAEKY